MTGKYLLAAAGAAILVATGTANAADVMPVMAPAPVVAVAPMEVSVGPQFSIVVENRLVTDFYFGDPIELDGATLIELGLRTAGGVTLQLSVDSMYDIAVPLAAEFLLKGRAAKTMGDFEFGVFLQAVGGFPLSMGLSDPQYGYDLAFNGDRLTVENENTLNLVGGFLFVSETKLTVAATDRLDLYARGQIEWPGYDYEIGAGAAIRLGPLTPRVDVTWSNTGFWEIVAGTDFEHALGNSPFAFVATAEYFRNGVGQGAYASAGIRFSHGE